jgi:hypothetical protein
MLRHYRAEIILFLSVLVLCTLAIRAMSEDPPKAPALKPGEEVKPTELEAAKLGKLKAQLMRDQTQMTVLQLQFQNLQADQTQLQAKIDAIVKDIEARVKKEKGAEVVYDQLSGEDGAFHVAPAPAAAASESKPHSP